jgi:hypothetical protein
MPGGGAIVAHAESSTTHVFQTPKKVFDRVRYLTASKRYFHSRQRQVVACLYLRSANLGVPAYSERARLIGMR